MHNTRKCTRSKEASPRTTSGVRFSHGNVFPRVRKKRYPGLMYVHASGVASLKGCGELSPGVERFVRHPGLESMRENAPRRVARIILDSNASRGRESQRFCDFILGGHPYL